MANLFTERDHTAPARIIFARVARKMVDAGLSHEIMEVPHVMAAARYMELLVLELADQYAKHGEEWFRERYKEHIA